MIIDGREFDRTQGIGGSDMPVIVGMSPYRSALDLWSEKRGEAIDEPPSLAMRIGSLLEDGIAKLYAEQQQVRVAKPKLPFGLTADLKPDPAVTKRFGFPTWAQVDRRRIGRPVRGVEVKHTSMLDRFRDGVPDDVAVQVQWGMLLTGWKSFDVVSLAGGRDLTIETVEADADVHDALVEAGRKFWRQVVEGEQPEADGSDAAGRYLRDRYQHEEEGKSIVATHDMLPTLVDHLEARARFAEAQREVERTKQQIMQIMEDAEVLVAPGDVKVTWKSRAGSRSWKDIAADYRRLIEQNADKMQLRGVPEVPEGVALTGIDAWLDFIDSMHTGAPSRVFNVAGKAVAL